MKKMTISLVLLAAILAGGWFIARPATRTGTREARRVAWYQDSMHPWVKSAQPGLCSICGMQLTPVYEGEKGAGLPEDMVELSTNQVTVLNVQTEDVKKQTLRRTLRVAGTIEPNDAKKTIISAPAAGRIESTAVDYAGVEVTEGQRLLTFYSAQLTQLKRRYLFRAQLAPDGRDPTGGLAPQTGDADPYYSDLVSPLTGTVIERNVFKGQYVAEGEKLFTIADASVLWFRFDVYEQQLPWVRLGQKVMVSLPAVPGKVFEAVITFIDPMLDPDARSVKVRADLANPVVEVNGTRQRLFKFGMYAEGEVRAEIPDTLAVPRTAVLFPGNAAYAYVDQGGDAYQRRRIKLGRQGDDLWEVCSGLKEGERVVTSGNVLMDAEAQFRRRENAEESEADAMDLTPPTVVKMADSALRQDRVKTLSSRQPAAPVVAEKPATSRGMLTDMQKQHLAAVRAAKLNALHSHSNLHGRPDSSNPTTYGAGVEADDEGDELLARLTELRNAELAAARKAKASEENELADGQRESVEVSTANEDATP